MRHAPTLPLLLLSLLFLPVGGLARADDALTVPRVAGLILDGRPDEPAWAQALRLPCEAVSAPLAPPRGTTAVLRPDVRLLEADGRLWVAVAVDEDPGTAIGLQLMLAGPDAHSAADAVSLSYRPVELRAPRYAVRGPGGAGRARYGFRAAATIDLAGRWAVEASVPLADLLGEAPDTPLRLAAVVFTRTPNVLASVPPDSRWHGPTAWLTLLPQEGRWGAGSATDRAALAAEDAADAACRLAWLDYLRGSNLPLGPERTAAAVRAQVQAAVLAPLDEVVRWRPDLLVPVQCLRGDVLGRLGDAAPAAAAFETALRVAPGWREAQYGLHLRVHGQRLAEGEVGGPSDYAEAFARLEARSLAAGEDPWAREGLDLARGLLLYKQGHYEPAREILERLAARYPHDAFLVEHAALARRCEHRAPQEGRRRAQDLARGLPRAFLDTDRGTLEVRLFEDDAPNTVNNFVWLARAGFYDGLAFHRSVPFFALQGGDPLSAQGADPKAGLLGSGTPGYAIRTETNDRPVERGVLAMANAGRDTEGSQFILATGTGAHLEGDQAVFGAVVGGMAVLDALRQGDRIQGVRFEGLDPARIYRPATVAGRPAPPPNR